MEDTRLILCRYVDEDDNGKVALQFVRDCVSEDEAKLYVEKIRDERFYQFERFVLLTEISPITKPKSKV